jgi:DNA invertase Pin-like site-specific DNA recombinase
MERIFLLRFEQGGAIMTEPTPRALRCAIYTRKSTDEGLEQDFNSLHAQRESAEAYVLSQRQAGWSVLPEHYDDGGFSGASIDRPALRNLLMQVEARAIDCVLVYKVDRLSRSLLDFARLMELFERNGVSFVSVTQDFNSTTSLGRLTLHILLSFAQFEREIISERTRDKLSAARRKGKWIGGYPVLGYDVAPAGGKLVVNEKEAGQVREMFRLCREAGTLQAAVPAIREGGFTTKEWTTKNGKRHPARPLGRSTLRLLLSNVLYTGSVSHKGTVYAGEHDAIVDRELWNAVGEQLRANGAHLRGRKHDRHDALLQSVLRCGECQGAMILTHTNKKGRRYAYYTCEASRGGPSRKGVRCSGRPVSASDLEDSLRRQLEPVLGQISRPVLQQSVERVSYEGSTGRVSAAMRDGSGLEYVLARPNRPGVRRNVTAGSLGRVTRVTRLLALAIKLKRLLSEGAGGSNRKEIAELGHISGARMSQIMGLTELAPSIQEELLFLPRTVQGRDRIHETELREIAKVIDWEQQRKLFRSAMDSAANRS